MCLSETTAGSGKMQPAQLPKNIAFNNLGSTVQSDEDMNVEVNKRTLGGWNNWRMMSGEARLRWFGS